jgi:hypothetical protein
MSSSANYENNNNNNNNIVKLVSENYITPAASIPYNENLINKNIVTLNQQQQQQRLKIKRPKSELGLNNITSNAAAFSFINLNETSNKTNNNNNNTSNFSQNIKQPDSSNMYPTDYTTAFTNLNLANSYLSIKKNFKLGLSNSNLSSSSSNSKSSNISNSFTLSNNFNPHSIRSHSNQNYRHYFFNRNRFIILSFFI